MSRRVVMMVAVSALASGCAAYRQHRQEKIAAKAEMCALAPAWDGVDEHPPHDVQECDEAFRQHHRDRRRRFGAAAAAAGQAYSSGMQAAAAIQATPAPAAPPAYVCHPDGLGGTRCVPQ